MDLSGFNHFPKNLTLEDAEKIYNENVEKNKSLADARKRIYNCWQNALNKVSDGPILPYCIINLKDLEKNTKIKLLTEISEQYSVIGFLWYGQNGYHKNWYCKRLILSNNDWQKQNYFILPLNEQTGSTINDGFTVDVETMFPEIFGIK